MRSPGLFKEYHRDPEATAQARNAEGWFSTGDAGYLDDDGHLRIIDRMKYVGALNDGTLHAPKLLENKLKFVPYIKEAVAFGNGRDMVCVLVDIDMATVGRWADKQNISYTGHADLASRDEVYGLIADCIAKVNAELAREPTLAKSQIHRFLILHKELDADDGMLTRTGKLRRGVIAERYRLLVDAMYEGRDDVRFDSWRGHEDGRAGTADDRRENPRREGPCGRTGQESCLNIVVPLQSSQRAFAVGAPILELNSISLRFGGVQALTDISFNVLEHEVRAIIGPNGAGKSSMLNVINGLYVPQEGSIIFRGERLAGMTPTRAAHLGIARTFQNIALFRGMSVLDNIMAGRSLRMRANFLEVALQLPRARREETKNREVVEEIIEFLEIEHIRKTPVARLPYGLQKRVELGRALAAEPKVLLLDEPMAGMNIEEKQDMCRFILEVNDHYGTTVVLIEHDMGVVMDISDRVVVLDYGKKIGDGTPDEVRSNQNVIDAYLGVAH